MSTFLVPTMLQRILDHPNFADTDLSSLAVVAYGAAAAPKELVLRALEALPHVAFANIFGQTETLGAYTTLAPGDHRNVDLIGSVGKALPGVEIRVVHPGTEDSVPAGEVGELVVLSDQNVQPGWFHTGDLARIDADGLHLPLGAAVGHHQPRWREVRSHRDRDGAARSPGDRRGGRRGRAGHRNGERVGALIVSKEPLTDEQVRPSAPTASLVSSCPSASSSPPRSPTTTPER